ERKKITDRMRSGKVRCFLQSEELICKGSVVPFGYSAVPNPNFIKGKTPKSILLRDENAPIVQEIFQMCIDGKTAKEIKQEMISRGIKTVKGNDFFSDLGLLDFTGHLIHHLKSVAGKVDLHLVCGVMLHMAHYLAVDTVLAHGSLEGRLLEAIRMS
ncbi:MAG: recombinase family protein, partial [Duncaniella sp.]|nr:recombinase family protein [Duncaniella sp.]